MLTTLQSADFSRFWPNRHVGATEGRVVKMGGHPKGVAQPIRTSGSKANSGMANGPPFDTTNRAVEVPDKSRIANVKRVCHDTKRPGAGSTCQLGRFAQKSSGIGAEAGSGRKIV